MTLYFLATAALFAAAAYRAAKEDVALVAAKAESYIAADALLGDVL